MNIDYKAIGKRIRFARINIGITQEALAEKADLSIPHMSNIENGYTKPGLPTMIRLADALHVSLDDLMRDNILFSHTSFLREANLLTEDCTENEIRIMLDVLKTLKHSIRENAVIQR